MLKPVWGPNPEFVSNEKLNEMVKYAEEFATAAAGAGGGNSGGGAAPSGAAGLVYATPAGAAGPASLRALVASDIPDASTTTKGAVTFAASGNATAGRAVQATDPRLSNPRTPTGHGASHALGGADAITPASIGAAPATETLAALESKISLTQKGAANGVASLGADGKVPASQLPPSVQNPSSGRSVVRAAAAAPADLEENEIWFDEDEAGSGNATREDVVLNFPRSGALISLSETQCLARDIYLEGTLDKNTTLEFLNLPRTWEITDLTARDGFTLSVRRVGGASTLVSAGELTRFRAPGGSI